MSEYALKVTSKAGCLDRLVEGLAHKRLTSLACACEGGEGFATFSVEEKEVDVKSFGAKETGVPVLHISVRNEAGCLSRVTSAFSQAGVTIGSLACACAHGDATGTVAVGLLPRK